MNFINLKKLITIFLIPFEFMQDTLLLISNMHNSPFGMEDEKIYFQIILLSHVIEKGLSLPNPRVGFGQAKIKDLLSLLQIYNWEYDSFPVHMSYGSLQEYLKFNSKHFFTLPTNIESEIKGFLTKAEPYLLKIRSGGTRSISSDHFSFINEQRDVIHYFLTSRFSCRRFTDEDIDIENIIKIAQLSQYAPSQCNRQSVKLHYYSTPSLVQPLLSIQGGAEGYKESVKSLLIVSSMLSSWSGHKQRSQAYVDASLAAMYLQLACHSLGYGSCLLNLAITNSKERYLKKIGSIPSSERIVVMLAIGIPDLSDLSVASSPRISVERYLSIH